MLSRSRMVVAVLLLSALCSVTAQLQIYQARISTNPSRTEVWKVEGVATVELGGLHPPSYVFDCNTTLNNGSGVRWTRCDGSHLNGLVVRPLMNGQRLDANGISYMHLGNYSCWDERTNEQLILRITDSNPAVVAVNSTVGVIQGGSITLEVYVSGSQTIQSTNIHWYRLNPTRQEITSGEATFQDSRRRMILRNVEASAAGPYECEAQIPLFGGRTSRASARIQLQVYVPPSVRQLQSNIEVIEWTTPFSISCSATGSPLPTIRWERAGEKALPVNAVPSVMTGNDSVTSTLTFTRQGIRYADRGGYRCVASNQHTTPAASDYTQITVRPTLSLEVDINGQAQQNFGEILFAPDGSRIKVECFASGNHYWQTSNGSRISTNSQDTVYQQTDPSRSSQVLHITSFSQDTVDMYTCVTNITGTLVQRGLFITSSNVAVVISTESRFVLPGNTTSLVATVHANPSPNTAGWYLNNERITPGNHDGTIYSITMNSTTYTLKIQNIQESRLGEYEFVATVGNLTARDSITLTFPDPPSSYTSPSTISTNIGDSVQFHCEAGGSGNLDVEWRRTDGLTLPADVVQRGNDLIIAQVQTSDAGTYICSVRNLAGRAENTTILNVFNRPTTTVTYQQLSVTSSTPYRLNLTHGDEGPTFACMSSGYFPPTLTWQKDNGGSPLPNQVNSVIDSSGVQPIHEVRWSRSLRYTDSGTYSCTAENDNGTDTATLDLLVQYHPEINTITPIEPVQSDPSASTPTFAIPASYTGVALTCSGFAWPPPTVQWLKNDRPLPSGISSEQTSPGPGIVSALLKWTRGFVASDMGQYKCLVRWDNTTVQSTVEIVKGSIVTEPPPSCNVDTTSIFFQVRVLEAGCDQWDAALKEHVGNQFQQELLRIVETECNCTVQLDSIQINNPPQCSENAPGGVVFRGTIRAQTVAATEEIFCAIFSWQRGGSLINLNENLYHVDSQCMLRVDSFTSQECAVTPTSPSIDTKTTIIIAVSGAGGLLAVFVVLAIVLCCIHHCCIKKRKKADVVGQQSKDAPTLQRAMFYGGPTVSPSPSSSPSPVHRFQQMQLPVFEDPAYSTPIPRSQRTHSVDPSPEHIPLTIRSISRDKLISYSSGSLNNMAASQHLETRVQPYSQPVSSTGSMTTVGRTHPPRVDTSRVSNHPIGAINPMSLTMDDMSENHTPGRRSSEGIAYHGNSYHGNSRRFSEGVAATSQVTHHLPAVDESGTREEDMRFSHAHDHRYTDSGAPTSASSIVKLDLSRHSASEELPPYSSRPPSLMGASTGSGSIATGRRPTSAGSESITKRSRMTSPGSESITYGDRPTSTCSSNIANGGQPWYVQSESDFSLNQYSRRPNASMHSGPRGRLPSDIQPYAQIHNSAIPPFTNQKPRVNGFPRAQPGPYAEPVMRNSTASIDTFTRVQNSPHLEMVTV